MIAIVIGGVLVAMLLSTLMLVDRIHRRELAEEKRLDELDYPELRMIAEKRRVLERDRAEWYRSDNDAGFTSEAAKIDKELLKLADEELKLLKKQNPRS